MTAFERFDFHLLPIYEAISAGNPHDGPARAAAINPFKSVLCLAPAGSGKTTELIYRTLACLTVSNRPEEILAITFTTKAAGEIVERLMSALNVAATGIPPSAAHELPMYDLARLVLKRDELLGWNLLLNPARLRIMTFDSFCAFLASKTPIMSGLGGGKTTEDPALVYRRAILETLGSVNSEDAPEVLREALEAVLTFSKNRFETLVPMFTALLGKRDQWASEIMGLDVALMEQAVSQYVDECAGEAVAQIRGSELELVMDVLKDASGVLNALQWAEGRVPMDGSDECRSYLRDFAGYILTADGNLRARVTSANGFPAGEDVTKRMNAALSAIKERGIAAELADPLRTMLALPDSDYPARSAEMCMHFTVILRFLLANLALAFEETASIDFPEVAQRAIQALASDGDEVGDALLEEDRINHLLVDEFQDTSPAQFNLILNLVSHWEEGDGRSMFFCGDRFQSIYLWRGATVDLFTSMVQAKRFGPHELEVVNLVVNFRSAPGVVEWNNKAYEAIFAGAELGFVPSVPFRDIEGGVEVHPLTSGPVGEGEAVAETILDIMKTDPEASIAVLVRGRSHLKHILPKLKEAKITVSGQDIDPITESAPVSEAIALIRSLWHLADKTSWMALLRAAFVGLSWADCIVVAQGERVVFDALNSEDVQCKLSVDGRRRVIRLLDAISAARGASRGGDLNWVAKSVWLALGGPATVDETEMGDIGTVFALLAQHTQTGCLNDPQAFFRAIGNLYASAKSGAVQIMTVHKAKGLEFDYVIIPGLNRGGAQDQTPLFYWRKLNGTFIVAPNVNGAVESSPENRLFKFIGSKVKADVKEEIGRLAYVGTTRAKKFCHLFVEVDKVDDDMIPKARSGSLLSCLWPAVESEVIDVEPGTAAKSDTTFAVPSKARLDSGFVVQLPAGSFIPASRVDQISADDKSEGEGSDYLAKLTGTVFHKIVEVISQSNVMEWNAALVKSKSQAIASMLRREGCPIGDVAKCVAKIQALVTTTIESKSGQWILMPRGGAGAEVQVSAYRNGRVVHRYLDLSFVDSGVYYIADWKTAGCPEGMDVEEFIRRECARYEAKMAEYRQTVVDAGVTMPVKTLLYFPSCDRLAEVG